MADVAVPKKKFSRSQWFTLCVIGSVHFSSAVCISLQAPFFPREAEKKGATATEHGLVLGIFEFVSFLSSPILGKYIDRIGPKVLLNSGIIIAASCSVVFGLLDLVADRVSFIGLALFIRIVEAVGASAALTAAFSITAAVFPDSVATTFATLEVFYGLGYIVGPLIGGALFKVGGFLLPFVVVGGVLILDGVMIYLLLPSLQSSSQPHGNLSKILKVPSVLLDSFCIMAAAISAGFYTDALEPHLRQFDLDPLYTGAMFVLSGGLYAVAAPFVGYLCERRVMPKHLTLLGAVLTATSYLLVGPAPGLPVEPSILLCVVGLIIHGIGFACILVPCFIDALRSAIAAGFPDDLSTYGLVSGLWASSFALGAFIGPSIAGILQDKCGFRLGSLFVIFTQAIVFIAMLAFLWARRRSRTTQTPPEVEKVCTPLIATWLADEKPCDKIYGSLPGPKNFVEPHLPNATCKA